MKYRGVTMLFVTHQLDQVRTLCDRALWLEHGNVAGIGDPVRVVDDYLQLVAGGKLAEPEPEGTEPAKAPDPEMLEEERWGSGEILLDRVSLLDHEGLELVALGGSTPVAIEMDIRTREPQDDFVFGIGIYHADGSCVYGTNSDIEGWASQKINGNATVRFVIPSLDLVAGNYRIDAAVHTRNGRAFDYRRGAIRVVVGSRIHDIGVYRPPHRWEFDGAIEVRRIDDIHRSVPAPIAESLREIEAGEKPGKKKRK
jgi:ABC-type glutathione transport system ATPase component